MTTPPTEPVETRGYLYTARMVEDQAVVDTWNGWYRDGELYNVEWRTSDRDNIGYPFGEQRWYGELHETKRDALQALIGRLRAEDRPGISSARRRKRMYNGSYRCLRRFDIVEQAEFDPAVHDGYICTTSREIMMFSFFTREKTPSLRLRPRNFKCFSTGEAGSYRRFCRLIGRLDPPLFTANIEGPRFSREDPPRPELDPDAPLPF